MRRFAVFVLLAVNCLLPQTWKQRGSELYRERRFSEAAAALDRHLQQSPNDFAAALLLGLSWQQAGKLPEAETALRRAVGLDPKHATARYSLARVEYLRGRLDAAQSDLDDSRRLGEPPARVEHLRGLIEEERHDPEAALAAYERAIAADRTFAPAYISAGNLLLAMARPRDALVRLNQALQHAPGSAEAHYHRARTRLALGQIEGVETDLKAAADLPQAARLLRQFRVGGVRPASRPTRHLQSAEIHLEDVAAAAGVDFRLSHHPTAEKHLPETMAGGLAVFDYNGDGRIDLFFPNGAQTPSLRKAGPADSNRLYRNDGGWRFSDVTQEAGLGGEGFAMGAAAGDFDNDGRIDLFVAGVNRNILYRNQGGRFEDVTRRAGIRDERWSVAAGWFDYDKDGYLDLFVVNYLDWSPQFDEYCGDRAVGLRVYCHPSRFGRLPNRLYRNRGDGTFEDTSEKAGIGRHAGKGMSLAFADYDADGWTDLFVTNDTESNFLFHNLGNGTFEETAERAGVAWNDDGKAISSMGADFGDVDNDGRPDLVVTALAGETFPLFHNEGNGFFRDASSMSGIARLSAPLSGWGVALADLNNDRWLDLFAANSHVTDNIERYSHDRYRQANSLFLNQGGRFRDGSHGKGIGPLRAHRGAVAADFDNDGRLDVATTSLGEPAELWRNLTPESGHWLALQLEGTRSNRNGLGAQIRVDGQYREMSSASGYASSRLSAVYFGLATKTEAAKVEIRWPSGTVQTLTNVQADRILLVREPDPPQGGATR